MAANTNFTTEYKKEIIKLVTEKQKAVREVAMHWSNRNNNKRLDKKVSPAW
nr:hypothetical protein [Pseudobacteroides cellulosolvens]